MALSSQSSRSGMGGRYRARRRSRRWLWVLLVGLLAGGTFYLFSGEGDAGDADGIGPAERIAAADRDANEADGADEADEREAVNAQPAVRDEPAASIASAGRTPRVGDMTPVSEVRTTVTRSREAERDSDSDSTASSREVEDREPSPPRQAERDTRSSSRERGGSSTAGIESDEIRAGMNLIADGELVEGRRVLSALLFDDRRRLSASDARAIRETLSSVNDRLIFSPDVVSGDPVAERYQVQSGDLLVRIARRYKLTYPFLEQINGIDASRLQVGQSIKLIRGPFHARVSKSQFRMDLFVRQNDGSPIYVRSFPVGIGEEDSTPEGMWVIEPNRKVVNPDWRNPRTGEYYRSDDPENPIGDYWLAMEGIDGNTADQRGYGIHGTIEPDSIGQAVSMGCIRLRDGDIDQVYHMLVEGESTVEVVR